MRRPENRGQVVGFVAAAAVAGGVAGWFGLGPLWAIAGVLAVPPFALAAWVMLIAFTDPDPESYLRNQEPYHALTETNKGLQVWRDMARRWPSQFREPLAQTLLTQADALCALHRGTEALAPAAEAVAIYQALAAEKPRRFTHGLAHALDRQARLLAATGRIAEAVEAITVAIRLYRNLPPAAAGDHVPDLAEAVAHQAGWLSELGLEELPRDVPVIHRYLLAQRHRDYESRRPCHRPPLLARAKSVFPN
jgi:tetratricopeptide (TPR) repeat protein